MVSGSFKSYEDLNQVPVELLPSELLEKNYAEAWTRVPFGLLFRNALILTAINVLGTRSAARAQRMTLLHWSGMAETRCLP